MVHIHYCPLVKASSGVSDGELYWAHFSLTSFLTHGLDSQPANERRACATFGSLGIPECLPVDYNAEAPTGTSSELLVPRRGR